jgi:LDH2 family malate/lactate/ureidoglycolate dehydrogenase
MQSPLAYAVPARNHLSVLLDIATAATVVGGLYFAGLNGGKTMDVCLTIQSDGQTKRANQGRKTGARSGGDFAPRRKRSTS